MNHTPGPWALETVDINNMSGTCHKIGPFPANGAYTHTHACVYADTIRRHDYGHSKVGDELLANARLIAAAPDLLESVRDMVTILSQIQNLLTGYLVPDSLEDQDDCINGILSITDHKETLQKQRKALKAIAKAEGKETT